LSSHFGHAQDDFYATDSVREIRIYFEGADWDAVLDSLYIKGDKERLLARIEIDGVNYDSVGVRYKGFSSVSVNRMKNPFNIKLDYTIQGQNHRGFDKLKLSNVIQDPSFVREVLMYQIARNYMPSSRANFANVYVNDQLFGLYTNVEAVNKDFISKHYSSRQNAFFKCNPEHLDLNGENSNLSMSAGKDTAAYFPLYDIRSDNGWQELVNLIDTLNNNVDDIENLLNVDRVLWMHALNYALVNFDSYIGYAQNYYLYRDNYGRFNPILWDLNMSFGSFRFTDASEYYQGFSVQQAALMDPLTHLNKVSVYPRPLIRKLLENDRYKKMYMAHLRTVMEQQIRTNNYYDSAKKYQANIKAHVLADPHKFYTDSDFENNIDSTVSDLIEYPGILDLMERRLNYFDGYDGYHGEAQIRNVEYDTALAVRGGDAWISAEVNQADEVFLAYRFGGQSPFQTVTMNDDGKGGDEFANDNIYGASIPNLGSLVQYYIYAENDSTGVFSPEEAAYKFYEIEFKIDAGDLVINEIMAKNASYARDPNGDFSDWIELYNNSSSAISTLGMYLSDEPQNKTAWALPDMVLEPDAYLIVWANGRGGTGLDANFKLSANGERLSLAYADGTVIDSLSFGEQAQNASWARMPNGTGSFVSKFPSLGYNNDSSTIFKEFEVADFVCYPNPTENTFHIKIESDTESTMQLIDINGHLLMEETILPSGADSQFSTEGLMNGIYLIRIINDGMAATKKLIKI